MTDILSSQLHIAVCDDDSADRLCAAEMTSELMEREGIPVQISLFSDAGSLLSAIHDGKQFAILLLDVMMEGQDGMELAAALRNLGDKSSIVFISSNREMALRGYEVSASRFLSKPIDREKLKEALLFCSRESSAKREILLPTAMGQSKISLSDISYAETWERGVRLHLKNTDIITKLHISELSELLPARQFVLCHRVYLVNLAQVKSVRYCELELKNGVKLPVSKYRLDTLKNSLVNYLES